MNELAPGSEAEIQEALSAHSELRIFGLGTRSPSKCHSTACLVSLKNLSGITDMSPADMTCSVRSGTPLSELQAKLAEVGLCLPCLETNGTVGGAYMANSLPGTWRDWVIGATFMLSDGTVAKSGSHAVKSVAGYDVHRFMAGTRGSLAICLEVILKVYPLALMPQVAIVEVEAPNISDPIQIALMKRAKQIFDPTNKLNPGEWGFM